MNSALKNFVINHWLKPVTWTKDLMAHQSKSTKGFNLLHDCTQDGLQSVVDDEKN